MAKQDRKTRRRWTILFILLMLTGVLCLGGVLFSQIGTGSPDLEFVPVIMHSVLEADYGADPNPARMPGVRLSIIWDAIYDDDPEADLETRKAALLAALQSPVPYVKPQACQGTHVIYATQDTWIDSANPNATHGSDTRLVMGREGEDLKRLLLYFPINDTIPQGTYIIHAHLEMTVDAGSGRIIPGPISSYSPTGPFAEAVTNWSNQPEPGAYYRTQELTIAGSHAWDATDVVQDCLLDRRHNVGLMLEPQLSSDFTLVYYSREADAHARGEASDIDRVGPRLVVDCGGASPLPERIAAATPTPSAASPDPVPTSTVPSQPTWEQPTPAPTLMPSPALPSPPPSPTPASTQPGPAAPSPTATQAVPTPTPLPPTPTSPPPPPPKEPDQPPPPPPPLPNIAVNDVVVSEGDLGTVDAILAVTLSEATLSTVSVDYASSDGTATVGSDYLAIGGTLSLAPGVTSQTITITVMSDVLSEDDEVLFVNLSNASNANIGDNQGQVTISDDDPPPGLCVDDIAMLEGDSGWVDAVFTVSLDTASGQAVTVDYVTSDGSAVAPGDYTATSGTLTFIPGAITQTIKIAVSGDTMVEANETFVVKLSNASNATIADGQGIGTIINDDGTSLSINDVAVTEGDVGTVDAAFTVSLDDLSDQTVSVDYATADGSASAPADYTAVSTTTLAFSPGVLTRTITTTIRSDALDEPDEAFFVNLSNPSNASIADNQGQCTIQDDDPQPILSVDDVTVTEGTGGTTDAVLTVTLSAPSGQTVTADYATADVTASAPDDYTAVSTNILIFNPGVVTRTITVTVQSDALNEPDETFFVNLSNPSNASIADGQGVGTIVDDDGAATVCSTPVITLASTGDTRIHSTGATTNHNYGLELQLHVRPDNDTTPRHSLIQFDLSSIPASSVVFCATLLLEQVGTPHSNITINIHQVTASWIEGNGPPIDTVGATWINRDKSAPLPWTTPGGDDISPAEASFAADTLGQRVVDITSLTQFWINNPGANFGLMLRAVKSGGNTANIEFDSREAGATAPRLVIDYVPSLAITDVTVTEGNSGTSDVVFTVTLSSASAQFVTVAYATANNTATTADNDYIAASGVLTFTPGSTLQTVTVQVVGDVNPEGTESFFVNLSNPTNAAISDGQGVGTIVQDAGGLALPPGAPQAYLPLIMK